MAFFGFVLVLISVFMHAGWNFLSKKSVPTIAFFFISSWSAAISMSWAIFAYGWPEITRPWLFVLLFIASNFGETCYSTGLSFAYRLTDISLAYPMARALPVLMIAILSALLPPHKIPSWPGICGLLVVASGCLMMPLQKFSEFSWRNYCGVAMRFIFLAAIGTTIYTLTDSELMEIMAAAPGERSPLADPFRLSFFVNFALIVSLGIPTLCSSRERANLRQILVSRKTLLMAIITGILSAGAYALVLWAMLYVSNNLGYLQAFRQMSLPLGVLFGAIFLREKVSKPKLSGIVMIVLGLIMIALSGK